MSNSRGKSVGGRSEKPAATYYIPRKFVFETSEESSKSEREVSKVAYELKKNLEVERCMPFIFSFSEPKNYKDAYAQLSKQVLSIYNHVRLLIVGEQFDGLKHLLQDLKVEQVTDCLSMIREIINGCCEKLQGSKDERSDKIADSAKGYEALLQKAEAKIRIFIRNEQIFRLNFDLLMQRCEEVEESLKKTSDELNTRKQSQEDLMKENLSLVNKLRLKDEEYSRLQQELKDLQLKVKDESNNLSTEILENTLLTDLKRGSSQFWTNTGLNILLQENKTLLNENANKTQQTSTVNSSIGRYGSSSKASSANKGVNEKKAKIPMDFSLFTVSVDNFRKDKQQDNYKSLKQADYKTKLLEKKARLNVSSENLNKSTENSQERSFAKPSSTSRNKNQTLLLSSLQDYKRNKSSSKERKLGESIELSSLLTNKGIVHKVSLGQKPPTTARPTSVEKSRISPSAHSRRVYNTENSPVAYNKPQKHYIDFQSIDTLNRSYSGTAKKSARSLSKGSNQKSMIIRNMLSDHSNKALTTKKLF